MAVLIIGTMDTKGREIGFLQDQLQAEGFQVLVMNAGSGALPDGEPDITSDQVFEAAGTSIDEIRQSRDRGQAVAYAALGVTRIVQDLVATQSIEGILSIGGSAGTTIGTAAMRSAPFGLPKIMISTLASGQTRPYVGGSDLIMMPSVADLAGLNRITRRVLINSVNAMIGMIKPHSSTFRTDRREPERPLVTATMFGVTTPCVDRVRATLESRGIEVIVFHATGVGGQTMETLVRDGEVDAVFDLTTTELADELVGGILSAGPDRLTAAVTAGIPQVVSLGALDMVNFGPIETVPDAFRDRTFHIHNSTVTLMRTLPEECEEIGRRMAKMLFDARAETVVMIPENGVSALDAPGQPFYDPKANKALYTAILDGLRGASNARIVSLPMHINDPGFADEAVAQLRIVREGSRQ